MKKPIEQLQKILCTVESVEKDVKEMRFGCRVNIKCAEKGRNSNGGSELIIKGISNGLMTADRSYAHINGFQIVNVDMDNSDDNSMSFDMADIGDKFYWITKIIGNPLSLKHLMMYCNEKKIILNIDVINGELELFNNGISLVIKYDITKELYEQEDKVLLDIINFLKG